MEKLEKNQLRTIIIGAAIVVLGAIAAIYVYTQKESEIKRLVSENVQLTGSMHQKDSIMNELELTFNEIENNLKLIKEKRSQLALNENEGAKDKKQAVLEDISLMNTMLEESGKKIEELEKKLKQSGYNLKSFEQRVAALSQNVELQNKEIASLKQVIEEKDFKMAELNTAIDEMNLNLANQIDSLQQKQMVIEVQTNELNKGHIAFGTRKELKQKGLITREGSFLGIGGAKLIEEDFDEDYFTALDIRETTTIPLHSSKAVIISDHPQDSYAFVKEDGKIASLEIKNPAEFWKISKYAVIEVKQ